MQVIQRHYTHMIRYMYILVYMYMFTALDIFHSNDVMIVGYTGCSPDKNRRLSGSWARYKHYVTVSCKYRNWPNYSKRVHVKHVSVSSKCRKVARVYMCALAIKACSVKMRWYAISVRSWSKPCCESFGVTLSHDWAFKSKSIRSCRSVWSRGGASVTSD